MSPTEKGAEIFQKYVVPLLVPLIIGGSSAVGGARFAAGEMVSEISGVKRMLQEVKSDLHSMQEDLREYEVNSARREERINNMRETWRETSRKFAEQQLRMIERIRALEVEGGPEQ